MNLLLFVMLCPTHPGDSPSIMDVRHGLVIEIIDIISEVLLIGSNNIIFLWAHSGGL